MRRLISDDCLIFIPKESFHRKKKSKGVPRQLVRARLLRFAPFLFLFFLSLLKSPGMTEAWEAAGFEMKVLWLSTYLL